MLRQNHVALYSCNASVIGRGGGRSAVAAAAYRAGEKLTDERQGLLWDFTRKRGVLHSEILLPDGAPAWAADRSRLWNEAELREDKSTRRNTALIARDFRIALPHEATDEQRLEVTRAFGKYLVARYGGAVDIAIHAPDRHGDDRNLHAHLMMTSRRFEGDGFGAKIRELDDRRKGPAEITAIREAWEGIQNRLLDQIGVARVSCKSFDAQGIDREATVHLGVSATAIERKGEATELGDLNREITARNSARERLQDERAKLDAEIINLDAEREKRAEHQAIRSEARTLEPDRILDSLTERRATFTRADLNRQLTEFLPDARARSAFIDQTLARESVIPLREDAAAPVSRYTTRAVLEGERMITAAAGRMEKGHRHAVSTKGIDQALDAHSFLDGEQRAALHWATRGNGLAVIAGEAGTGKSATLAAIRDAYQADGFKVTGLAWTNAVVQDMKRDGFDQASTLAAALMRQNSGRDPWNRRTVLILDEAAMVSTKHLAALLAKADSAGAKVILAGDAKQLASIERGGMFAVLTEKHGAAELHTVRRVKDSHQQQAFNAMHRGDFRSALDVFDKRGAIRWNRTPEDTQAALVTQWAEDSANDPGKSRFVFAYTNAEVNELNQQIRAVRRARGELGEDHVLPTRDGPQSFAIGDRVQFTGNAATAARRNAGLFNGAAGIVQAIDGNRMTVALDTAKGAPPREIDFAIGPDSKAGEFDAIRHGYAGTIYKGQGKTLDQTYLLHSDSWRSASSYVALSRHRETVTLFAAEKAAAWVMAGGGVAGLNDTQRASAERSYAAWAEAKPNLAARYGFADYVGYVQRHWAEEKRIDPLDRLARQMGRVEERRAASEFVEGAREVHEARRLPPLSIVAGIVGDYLKLCYDPAKDWLRWVTEDLRHKAALRRDAAPTKSGRNDVYTEGAGAAVENTERIRRDPLHEMQGRMDANRHGRGGADGLFARPRADYAGFAGLRPLRTSRGLAGDDLAAAAAAARAAVRDRLAESSQETLKPDASPKKSRDIFHRQGSGRGHSR